MQQETTQNANPRKRKRTSALDMVSELKKVNKEFQAELKNNLKEIIDYEHEKEKIVSEKYFQETRKMFKESNAAFFSEMRNLLGQSSKDDSHESIVENVETEEEDESVESELSEFLDFANTDT